MIRILGGVILAVLVGLVAKSSGDVTKGSLTYYLFGPAAGAAVWLIMHRLLARP
jgi:hypothetical protein